MFNKPALFPKSPETQLGRGSRLGAGGSASGAVADPSAAAANAAVGSKDVPTSVLAAGASQAGAETSAVLADEQSAAGGGSRLIVGPNVKLKGAEILDCDTLIVEGRVEATMDSRVVRIAENGSFSGTVGIDVAEIYGRFEGELTARSQLVIHSTGRVSGKIRYGKILIEEGGEISGDVQGLAATGKEQPSYRGPERIPERAENSAKVA